MRFLTTSRARATSINCASWTALDPSATADEVRRGGYAHDLYRAFFAGEFDGAVRALLAYRIFPVRRMSALVCTPDRQVALGATIVQRVRLGPVVIESAVRVIDLERGANRVSFTYATLRGHAERGVASFAVIRDTPRHRFEAEAWSRAGHWFVRLDDPMTR